MAGMEPLPDPEALVLVAVLPSPRDLEIARMLGWYRIPLRTAPKLIAVDYLAFYQPASFGEHKWRVEFCAPVLGHELISRVELIQTEPDHPKAQEEYFKIQIGFLLRLPRPVLADRWKRLTFLYTTGAYLLSAEVLGDLVVKAKERPRIWLAMRERALKNQRYDSKVLPAADLDPETLAGVLGLTTLRG